MKTVAAATGAGIGLGIILYAISSFLGSKDKENQTQ